MHAAGTPVSLTTHPRHTYNFTTYSTYKFIQPEVSIQRFSSSGNHLHHKSVVAPIQRGAAIMKVAAMLAKCRNIYPKGHGSNLAIFHAAD